jgi:O-antigen ligase
MKTRRSGSKSANQHPGSLAILLLCAMGAIAIGACLPLYLGGVGGHPLALLVFPVALVMLGLFFSEPRLFFFMIMAVRSACDGVFESARTSTGTGPGIGALINASVIALALYLLSKEEIQKKKPILMAWGFFFVTAIYGLLLSPIRLEAARLVLAWVSNLAVFYCASYFVRSAKDFTLLLYVILVSSVAPVLYGIYVILASGLGSIGSLRIQSTFTHPNIFAFYLAFVINVVFCQLKTARHAPSGWARPFLFLWMVILLGMLVCTQTRSAWLTCILLFVFFGMLIERRYIVYILVACALALLFDPIRDRIFDLNAPEVETSQTRLDSFRWRVELWTAGLTWMEIKHYVFGYGIGAFSENAPIFFPRGDGIKWDAHNVYVQWFFEVGLVGLVGYTWIHLRLLYLSRMLFSIDKVMGFVVILTIVNYLMVSFSDNMMFYLAFNWYYWMFLGGAGSLLFCDPQEGTASITSVTRYRPLLLN